MKQNAKHEYQPYVPIPQFATAGPQVKTRILLSSSRHSTEALCSPKVGDD